MYIVQTGSQRLEVLIGKSHNLVLSYREYISSLKNMTGTSPRQCLPNIQHQQLNNSQVRTLKSYSATRGHQKSLSAKQYLDSHLVFIAVDVAMVTFAFKTRCNNSVAKYPVLLLETQDNYQIKDKYTFVFFQSSRTTIIITLPPRENKNEMANKCKRYPFKPCMSRIAHVTAKCQ